MTHTGLQPPTTKGASIFQPPLSRGGLRGVYGFNPYSANPADEETDYEYDQENRLTDVALPSGTKLNNSNIVSTASKKNSS